ncbi:MerR family transcriptional regulator [Clostridium sp. UBA7503]|uniref:helix-turn-helix domain-containing protein n=1 Tax=Clostridium sp. UBA7503 TaxID=1946377 RepID=UPI003217125D
MRTKLIKGELSKLLNITKATIRYYEDKKVISASKDENGYNLYDWEDLENISNILFLKDLGVSIEDVKKYKEDEKDIKTLLEDKRYTIDNEIYKLKNIRSRLDTILNLGCSENIVLNTVQIKQIQERQYLTFKKSKYNSIKEFYDNAYRLYAEISSCSQSFILLHKDYDHKKHSFENSKMLLPYIDNVVQNNLCEILIPKSNYIIIKYVYKNLKDFECAYEKIVDYAESNNLKIDKSCFIEIEYKDYSILYKEKMYELQFQIF